jgi:hypothetical protein
VQLIDRTIARGNVIVGRNGKIDPQHPTNAAYAAAHQARVARLNGNGTNGDAALAERTASLGAREYELAVLRANTVERVELADLLCAEAAVWQATMRAAPGLIGGDLADLVGQPSEPIVAAMTAAMTAFLQLRGDQDAEVRKALDRAAQYWNRTSLTRLPAPPVPVFERPSTLAEASSRYAAARGDKARALMRLRSGELLIKREADYAAAALRLHWIRAGQEEFVTANGAELLGAAGIKVDHGLMHAFWMIVWEHFAGAFVPIWPQCDYLGHPGVKALVPAYTAFIELRPATAPPLEDTAWYAGSRLRPLAVPEGMEDTVDRFLHHLTGAAHAEKDPTLREMLERVAGTVVGQVKRVRN